MSEDQIGQTAGALLRNARLAQGMDLGALAAAIKVTPHKLEMLEADRFDELHGAAYARALAQTVCRSLKIEPSPVLDLLPQLGDERLDQINQGLNTPFRDRPGRTVPGDWSVLAKPMVWGPALIMFGAALLYFWPSSLVPPTKTVVRSVPPAAAPASAVAPPEPVASAPPTVIETVHAAPPPRAEMDPTGTVPPAPSVRGVLQLRTTAQSWVEVLDAGGQLLISRTIQPGEAVGLDGALPLRLRIGNSAGTQLTFRGEAVDLRAYTRGNVANLELK